MNKPSRDEWMREVELSQRNTVFPDTVSNEARFWRNIISGKQPVSAALVVFAVLVCGILATLAAWLSVVPRQYSTGGQQKRLGIRKRGNLDLRRRLGRFYPAVEITGIRRCNWQHDGRG